MDKLDTNWSAISNLIGDMWMYINPDSDNDSMKLYGLVECLDKFVDSVLSYKQI